MDGHDGAHGAKRPTATRPLPSLMINSGNRIIPVPVWNSIGRLV